MLSGYLHNTGIFLVTVVFISLISCVLPDVIEGPLNTAGTIGSRPILTCKIDGTLQQWRDDYSGAELPTISTDGQISGPYQGKYEVEGESQNYNLALISAAYTEAGTHACVDIVIADVKKAEIIVLGSNTSCVTNSTDTNNILIEGEYVNYMCNIIYNGLWGPKMTWSSNTGVDINPDDESNDTSNPKLVQHSYTTVVTSNNDGQSLRVVTSFDPPTSVPDPENSATNAPNYTHTWNSPSITVHYPPRDILFQHCTDSGCSPIGNDDLEISVNPGDRIHASATANPNVDYYTWKNDSDISLEGTDKTELTFNYTGSSSIECIVRNTMRGDTPATTSRTIVVMVVPTTTPPSTTTPIPTIPSSPETSTATGGPPATDESTEKDGLGAGAIAGIAIGVLAAIVICVIIIICVCRKSDKEKKANETMPPKKVHADQVRQPENNGPTTITNIDEKPPYDYNQYPENPYDNNVNPYAQDGRPNENLVYADLALDDTPRSRKPVQVFEPVQYAEIRRV